MIYLILSVLFSAILAMLMVFLRVYKIKSWERFINSKFMQRVDLFFENLFKLFGQRIIKLFRIIKRIVKILSIKVARFLILVKRVLNLIFKKIISKTNKQINKLYPQKTSKPVSKYLKNIGEYKNKTSNGNERIEF